MYFKGNFLREKLRSGDFYHKVAHFYNFDTNNFLKNLLFLGLIDPGESAETAAIRELKEETGYVASIKHRSPRKYLVSLHQGHCLSC